MSSDRSGAGLRAVDLFAGWGGFTLGASSVGVDVVWASNHWPRAVECHARNHPTTQHSCQDLRQADWTTLPEFDVLLASPACQGHSSASQPRRRRYHDALRSTAFAVVDCADVTEPAAIVVENVPNFLNWRLYRWWREGLERLGYVVSEHMVNASAFGVPQRRRRLFVTATRPGVTLPPFVTVGSGAEPPFSPCVDQTVPASAWTPVAHGTVGVRERVRRGRARHGSVFLSQHTTGHVGVPLSEPIRTITTAPCHWNLVDGDRYRALTGRELARGMGFPDSFTWSEDATVAEVTRGLGNAVCPPVAAAVVGAVVEALG